MKGQGGFTLLELTVAMTVVAVLAAAVVSVFSTGLQVWEKVQRESDENQEAAAVLEILSSDIRGAWLGPAGKEGNFVSQQGSSSSEITAAALTFTSLVSKREAGRVSEFVEISYRLDYKNGILYRSLIPVPGADVEQPAVLKTELEEEEITDDVLEFTVRCWDGADWQERWPVLRGNVEENSEENLQLPHMVEITLQFAGGGGNPRQVSAVVPIEMAHP
jgi:general secretion pathway protein J